MHVYKVLGSIWVNRNLAPFQISLQFCFIYLPLGFHLLMEKVLDKGWFGPCFICLYQEATQCCFGILLRGMNSINYSQLLWIERLLRVQ